jgi:hypothetical protein
MARVGLIDFFDGTEQGERSGRWRSERAFCRRSRERRQRGSADRHYYPLSGLVVVKVS